MSTHYESGFTTTLALALAPADVTATLATVPTVTSGRMYIKNGDQREWINFTGVSGSTITGLTRSLSSTADPATGSTGLTWIAGTEVILVAMHDQLPDKTASNTFATGTIQTMPDIAFSGTTTQGFYAKPLTTAQRLALTPSNGAIVYDTSLAVLYQYIGGAWTTFATAGATPAMTTTSLGGAEKATQAENTNATASGSVGPLVATPDIMATTIQRGERLYGGASAAGTDTYAITLVPTPAAYTTGMIISFKTDVVNTGACTVNANSLGAKSIKMPGGVDPGNGELPAGAMIVLEYDGTSMIAIGGTRRIISSITTGTRARNGANATVTYNHTLGRIPLTAQVTAILREDTNFRSYGVYDNITGTPAVKTTYQLTSTTSGNSTSNIADLVGGSASGQQGVIGNFTSTTFDITWTVTGASAGTIDLFVTLT